MHPALVGHIRSVRAIDQVPNGTRVERLPDGTTGMLLRVLDDGRGEISIAGPRSRALFKTLPPARRSLLVDFEPGSGATFLGSPVHPLVDRYGRLEDTWGRAARQLCDRMLATGTNAGAWEVLEEALVLRVRMHPMTATTRLARRAAQRLTSTTPPERISDLAAELGVSTRHLRRAFADNVGLAPKELARMARLQRALAPSGPGTSWAERALDAGYYDQAHFIADFRDLVGTTPARFARRDRGRSTSGFSVVDRLPY